MVEDRFERLQRLIQGYTVRLKLNWSDDLRPVRCDCCGGTYPLAAMERDDEDRLFCPEVLR